MSVWTESGKPYLIAYIYFEDTGFGAWGRALSPLVGEGYPELSAPHLPYDDKWWTLISVMNSGDLDTVVTFTGYTDDGEVFKSIQYEMKADQSMTAMIHDVIPGLKPGEIASLTIVSSNNQALTGYLLYGTSEKTELVAFPILPVSGDTVYLSHLASSDYWWTGIGMVNGDEVEKDFLFTLYDAKGNDLETVTRRLKPHQRLAVTTRNLFQSVRSGKYIKIEGGRTSGIYCIGSADSFQLLGDVLK